MAEVTTNFSVEIPNLPGLIAALKGYPEIATPVFEKAMKAVQAKVANHTTASTVPVRTRALLQNWGFEAAGLQARYYPKMRYARYVQEGTRPHVITAKNARVLASKTGGGKGAQYTFYGKSVMHPGTKPNPFMNRIMAASKSDIINLFLEAERIITRKIAEAAS